MDEEKKEKVTFDIDKNKNFSNWFTEIVKSAELADLRFNVKGFLVFQPWSVLCMEAMYDYYERALQKKGHKPYWYPALIPESNMQKETEHVEGFAPEVFWVTQHGDGDELEEKLALRPTSETAFYQMFSIWLRSYNDLPFKTYQRAQVWRYETKATRPFLRSREFHWIESHNAFANANDAQNQVKEDMETTKEVMHDIFGIPFIFFERPQWDTFAGAEKTYAADTRMPGGKLLQLPSTHFLGQDFSKAFDVTFTDPNGEKQFAYLTCYGPAISRIFAAVIASHGDRKGLRFPFEIAPLQIIIVPIAFEKDDKVLKAAEKIKEQLFDKGYRVEIDAKDEKPGNKFYFWEMKGVPFRIELGPKEIEGKELTIFRRDTEKKETIKEAELLEYIEKDGNEISENLRKEAEKAFEGCIQDAKNAQEVKKIIDSGFIARCDFCTIERSGEKCAETVEKDINATVRGIRIDKKEIPKGECVFCKEKAQNVVYIGRQY